MSSTLGAVGAIVGFGLVMWRLAIWRTAKRLIDEGEAGGLQRQRERVLEPLADAAEELGGVGAVEDAVVAGERELHDRADVTSPSRTTGRGVISPTARIAACGGLITAVKRLMPNMPRFETLNVPEDSSGGVILPARTRSASARASRLISPSDLESASNIVGTMSASWPATAMPTLTRE